MEQVTAIGTIIITSIFFLAIFIIANFLLYKLFIYLICKKKEIYAKKLIENGFKIETFDYLGMPVLLKKGDTIVNVWEGKKQ